MRMRHVFQVVDEEKVELGVGQLGCRSWEDRRGIGALSKRTPQEAKACLPGS